MTSLQLTSNEVGQALHPVFDAQISNYGAYNLVFASGSALYPNPDVAAQQEPEQQHFLIGYRDTPQEAIIAPLHLPYVRSAGAPTSVDNTNVTRTFIYDDYTFGIELTNGTAFRLCFTPLASLETAAGSGVLDQELDIEDFKRVIIEAWVF
ncbi:MAG: hypothetical protein Q3965_04630 [Rothia sp. (in: high G+C Gram-positive bacteria)]|nr:hypothetical protein [Rothia sp. (in: high G+C Gram-positive bacteria)]